MFDEGNEEKKEAEKSKVEVESVALALFGLDSTSQIALAPLAVERNICYFLLEYELAVD